MANTKYPQISHNVFIKRQNTGSASPMGQGVRQDKRAFPSARSSSTQPAAVTKRVRARHLSTNRVRVQNRFIDHQNAVQVTTWVKPVVRAELERIAAEQGISLSATSAALLEEAVRQKLHIQHAVLLQPIIEQAIRKQMKGISTRLAWLLVRVAFDAGQTRSLVTNILDKQPGVTQERLKTLLEQSSKTAKRNITRRTPQLIELMEAVEQWMSTEREEQDTHD